MSAPHITTDELRDAYTRIGMTFAQAQGARLIRWSLEKSALARRRRYALPAQPRLI